MGAPRTRLLRKRKAASKGWNREISKWNKDSVGKHQSYARAKNATTFFTGLKTCVRLNAKMRVQFIQEISRQHSIPAMVKLLSSLHFIWTYREKKQTMEQKYMKSEQLVQVALSLKLGKGR